MTPTIPLVDGVVITSYTRARLDGGTVNALNIPVVSSDRQEQDSSSPQADIALAVLQGQTLLKAEVPTGIGMAVEDLSDSPSRRTDLLDAIKSRTTAQLTDQRHLLDLGQFFLNTLPDAANLWVRTVIISLASNSDASGNLTFRGVSDSSNPSALVLDFTSLPKNSTVALENVQFGAIVGEVSVTTGDGNQLLVADSQAQTLDLGAGDDIVYAGGGNDILKNTRGNDRLFGQGGNDTLSGENGQNILHGGADSDTAVFAGRQDDYTVEKHHGFVRVINKADPGKSTLVVNSETLQFADGGVAVESAPALNALAGLYQQILGRQADIYGFEEYANKLESGRSLGWVALEIIKSSEGKSQDLEILNQYTSFSKALIDSLIEMYVGYFNRAPEKSGLQYWVDFYSKEIASGRSDLEIQKDIANKFYLAGADYSIYAKESTTEDFIKQSYLNALGRDDVDEKGLNYWRVQLENGNVSHGELIKKLIDNAKLFADDPLYSWVPRYLSNRVQVAEYYVNNSTELDAIRTGKLALSAITASAAQGGQNTSQALMLAQAMGLIGKFPVTGDAESDVGMLYQALFGQTPDPANKANWVQAIQSGSFTLEEMSDALIKSPEMNFHYIEPTGWDFVL